MGGIGNVCIYNSPSLSINASTPGAGGGSVVTWSTYPCETFCPWFGPFEQISCDGADGSVTIYYSEFISQTSSPFSSTSLSSTARVSANYTSIRSFVISSIQSITPTVSAHATEFSINVNNSIVTIIILGITINVNYTIFVSVILLISVSICVIICTSVLCLRKFKSKMNKDLSVDLNFNCNNNDFMSE